MCKIKVCRFFVLGFSESHSKIASEKWFCSMKNVLEILNSSHAIQCTEEIEERLEMYRRLSKLEAVKFENFLHRKLRSALRAFTAVSDSSMLCKDGQELLFLSRVVLEGVK